MGSRPSARAIVHLAQVGSTNSYARQAYRSGGSAFRELHDAATTEGALPVDVVVTDEQTQGRGRLGRIWQSGVDEALCASFVVPLPRVVLERGDGGWVTACAGLAAVDALRAACDDRLGGLSLKWPNDLLWGGRKLGGILCETAGMDEGCVCVVVGIGINLLTPAERLPLEAATSLAVHVEGLPTYAVLRDALVDGIAGRIGEMLWRLATRRDAARDDLLVRTKAASCTLGHRVEVRRADGTSVVGRAVDIRRDMALVVKLDDGSRVVVTAGDVGVLSR
ncbi:biotin--[acetyl-CoA-carboxylase] ligase [Olsenella profusa]|uniref:biotin--[acetyl-CoA-carboxylase] ligase n=1 Tax=Olsenella profusa TaxID=138595 RepID=UPI00058C0796|nr:biotin--[acetyl-CoA-carboxylase] ligase [Olsenella profusa]